MTLMRLLPSHGQCDNDEVLACAADLGRIRVKVSFWVQVAKEPTPKQRSVKQYRGPRKVYVPLKEPFRFFIEAASPDGVIALVKQIRRAVAEINDIVRRQPGETTHEAIPIDTAPIPKQWGGRNFRKRQLGQAD